MENEKGRDRAPAEEKRFVDTSRTEADGGKKEERERKRQGGKRQKGRKEERARERGQRVRKSERTERKK